MSQPVEHSPPVVEDSRQRGLFDQRSRRWLLRGSLGSFLAMIACPLAARDVKVVTPSPILTGYQRLLAAQAEVARISGLHKAATTPDQERVQERWLSRAIKLELQAETSLIKMVMEASGLALDRIDPNWTTLRRNRWLSISKEVRHGS